MDLGSEFLKGIIQVITRRHTPVVQVDIRDSSGLPPYEIVVNLGMLATFISQQDLASLTTRELVDLASLYYSELKDSIDAELKRRGDENPDFKRQLTAEVLPRLRRKDDPAWRYQSEQ